MTPISTLLEQSLADMPIADLPAFLGVLATVQAKAQLKLMMGPVAVTSKTESLLTAAEVAAQLKMSSYRVYELCRRGKLPSIHLGKSVRVRVSAVAEYLAKQGGG